MDDIKEYRPLPIDPLLHIKIKGGATMPAHGLGKRIVLTKHMVSNHAFCTHGFAFCTHGFLYASFSFLQESIFFGTHRFVFCTHGFKP